MLFSVKNRNKILASNRSFFWTLTLYFSYERVSAIKAVLERGIVRVKKTEGTYNLLS